MRKFSRRAAQASADEQTARRYLLHAKRCATAVPVDGTVVIDLTYLREEESFFGISQYIRLLAGEFGLETTDRPKRASTRKLYLRKIASS